MKLYDKIIIIIAVAFFIIVYLATDITFDMVTYNNRFENGLVIYIVSFTIAAYYFIKYSGFKKWSGYATLIFASVLLWVSVGITTAKLKLLISYAGGAQTEDFIKINNVRKKFTKSSFSYTLVDTRYKNQDITFETSCTNFFALENKDSIKVIIGKASMDNYFITKVFWKDGEVSAARYKYWRFWWSRNWFWPVALAAFIMIIIIMVKFGKPAQVIRREDLKPKKPVSFWRAMAIVMLVVLGIMVVAYLGLIAYVYIVHGGCPQCKFW